jgi:hypothetical protein
VIIMMGTIFVTRSLDKNSKGYYDFEAAFLKSGAFDAFNQLFSVALADYPKIREVAQEMEIIDQMNLHNLNADDFNTAVKQVESFFKNLRNPTELQELARSVWEKNVVALVRKDSRYQPN